MHRLLIHTCENCHAHQWCTRHKEERYQRYYKKVEEHLCEAVPDIVVHRPTKAEVQFLNEERVRVFGALVGVTADKLGAFEVYLDNILIFSKHKTNRWPRMDELSALARMGVQEYANSESYANLIAHLKQKFQEEKRECSSS